MQSKQRIRSPKVQEPADGLWSNCLRVGDVVYISGLTARGSDGQTVEGNDAYEQSRVIFGKIAALIQAAGGVVDDVIKLTIFVTDISTNQQVWRARREVFSGDFPASSLVEVSALAKPEILVEIEAVAHVGCSRSIDSE
jgi:2-iminobutanoate/2-iminopropanoate deaminase